MSSEQKWSEEKEDKYVKSCFILHRQAHPTYPMIHPLIYLPALHTYIVSLSLSKKKEMVQVETRHSDQKKKKNFSKSY